jgi:hypothetical protein
VGDPVATAPGSDTCSAVRFTDCILVSIPNPAGESVAYLSLVGFAGFLVKASSLAIRLLKRTWQPRRLRSSL